MTIPRAQKDLMLLNAQSTRIFTRNSTKDGSVHQLVDKIVNPTEPFIGTPFSYTEKPFEFEGFSYEDLQSNTYMKMGSEFEKCITNAWRGISNEGSSFANAGEVTVQMLKDMNISYLKNKCKIIHRTAAINNKYRYVEGEVDILGMDNKSQELCIFEVKLTMKNQFIAISWLLQIIVYALAIKYATNKNLNPIYLIVGSFKDKTIRVVQLDWTLLIPFVAHLKMGSDQVAFFPLSPSINIKPIYFLEITNKDTKETIYEFKLPEETTLENYDFSMRPVLTFSSCMRLDKPIPSTIPKDSEVLWTNTFTDRFQFYIQSTITGLIIHKETYQHVTISLKKKDFDKPVTQTITPPETPKPISISDESRASSSSSSSTQQAESDSIVHIPKEHYWKTQFNLALAEYNKQQALGKDVAFEELTKANGISVPVAIQYTADIMKAVKALEGKDWIKKNLKVTGISDSLIALIKGNPNFIVYAKV